MRWSPDPAWVYSVPSSSQSNPVRDLKFPPRMLFARGYQGPMNRLIAAVRNLLALSSKGNFTSFSHEISRLVDSIMLDPIQLSTARTKATVKFTKNIAHLNF